MTARVKRRRLRLATPADLLPYLAPGTVSHLVLIHESDCPRLRGGPCRCEPTAILEHLDPRPEA